MAPSVVDVLSDLRCVLQPIFDLGTGDVVAYEALTRGPADSPYAFPDALFGAARAQGCLDDLDRACRRTALRTADALGLRHPLTLFVNVEPEALDPASLAELAALVPAGLRLVLEITERALGARPSALVRAVEQVRRLGWGIALDDVGADPASLTFMPLLRPDVVKLDLRLVQQRPDADVAEIIAAVNAYAESSGAVVLAEGIEHEGHVRVASAMGAAYGQGYHLGRPAPTLLDQAAAALAVPPTEAVEAPLSPFDALPPGTVVRRSTKPLLVQMSLHLEREAARLGKTCLLAGAFQHEVHFTAATRSRYTELASSAGYVCALGEGLQAVPAPGVAGASLLANDPLRAEWDVVVLAPHYSAALLARDLGDPGPEDGRRFDFVVTYRRDVVVQAALALLGRVDRTPVPVQRAQPPPYPGWHAPYLA